MSKLPYVYLICTLVQGLTFPVQTRVVAAYLKVVRQMRPSKAERSRLGRALDPLSMAVFVRAPRRKRILTASLCVLNAFFAEFGTRFQSFLVTNFLSKNARNNPPS